MMRTERREVLAGLVGVGLILLVMVMLVVGVITTVRWAL